MAEATTVGDSLENLQAWFSTGFENFFTGNWLELTWSQLILWVIALIFTFSYALDVWEERKRNKEPESGHKPFYKTFLFWLYVVLWFFGVLLQFKPPT